MRHILGVFGRRLKELRREKQMTQDELAERLGLHNSYIGLLERGERIPSLITLDKIAKSFGVKPADLIMEEKRSERLNIKQKELLYIVRDGAPENVDKLYKVARIIIDNPKRTGRKRK